MHHLVIKIRLHFASVGWVEYNLESKLQGHPGFIFRKWKKNLL